MLTIDIRYMSYCRTLSNGDLRLQCRLDQESRWDDATTVRLIHRDEQFDLAHVIGEYPGEWGAHWSIPNEGRAGWYLLVDVPADLPYREIDGVQLCDIADIVPIPGVNCPG